MGASWHILYEGTHKPTLFSPGFCFSDGGRVSSPLFGHSTTRVADCSIMGAPCTWDNISPTFGGTAKHTHVYTHAPVLEHKPLSSSLAFVYLRHRVTKKRRFSQTLFRCRKFMYQIFKTKSPWVTLRT